MPNRHYSEFGDEAEPKPAMKPPKGRPAAERPTLSRTEWKMPKTPGPGRRVHKMHGRRVRQMAREDY